MKHTLFLFLNMALLAGVIFIGWKQFGRPSRGEVLQGSGWTAKKFGDKYFLSIANRSELVAAVNDFVRAQKLTAGNITGIGAVNAVTLRFFDPQTKQYVDKSFNGQMEITNLSGNISTMDGKEYVHLHITLGDKNYQALAGHLLSADINGAGELFIEALPAARVERSYNPEIGLNFYDFAK